MTEIPKKTRIEQTSLSPESRVQFSYVQTKDSFEWFSEPVYPEIEQADDDVFVEVTHDTTLDMLALKHLGSVERWWVIAVLNGLELIPSDMYVGQKLRVPAKRRIDVFLRETKRNRLKTSEM